MEDIQSWDWNTPLKEIPVEEWASRFNWVEDPCIAPDGEAVAAIVNLDEMAFGVCVSGELWDGEFEKAWSLKAVPGKGFAAAVCEDEEWTLMVNGQTWSNRFDFIWDLSTTPDGEHVGLAFQRDMEYGMAVDDACWESTYENMTGMTLGPRGNTAAVVQVESMSAADVNAFAKGLFSVAVGGAAGNARFLNAWDISFDDSCDNLAWAVRLDREQYSVAMNDTLWENRFQQVWKPVFQGRSVVAPVRHQGKWRLFRDDAPFWSGTYDNLWRLLPSGDGSRLAAVAAPEFGKWTVVENDRVWPVAWDTMVREIRYADNGTTLAAVFKNRGCWGVAVNGVSWDLSCDRISAPAMSRDGNVAAVSFERSGQQFVAVNDRVVAGPYQTMADPVVSPDGDKILIKGIEDGIYKRRVVDL